MSELIVRPTAREDLPAIRQIVDATGLFPSELLDAMVAAYLRGGESEERWLTAAAGNRVTGFAYYVPEQMTDGTWNLLAIAVDPRRHGQGVGRSLLLQVERELGARGGRVLLVETSGLPEFARTRAFYLANGYVEEARIRDFYAAGDDQVVYWKRLS